MVNEWLIMGVVMGISSSSWGYPNSWMVYFMGNSHEKMDDEEGYPYDETEKGRKYQFWKYKPIEISIYNHLQLVNGLSCVWLHASQRKSGSFVGR